MREFDLEAAAKMALEALEEYTGVVSTVHDANNWHQVVDGGKPAREAIAALRQALAEPKREWQSLTDYEIYPMYCEPRSDAEMIAFAREFEAKLKEKNT